MDIWDGTLPGTWSGDGALDGVAVGRVSARAPACTSDVVRVCSTYKWVEKARLSLRLSGEPGAETVAELGRRVLSSMTEQLMLAAHTLLSASSI